MKHNSAISTAATLTSVSTSSKGLRWLASEAGNNVTCITGVSMASSPEIQHTTVEAEQCFNLQITKIPLPFLNTQQHF